MFHSASMVGDPVAEEKAAKQTALDYIDISIRNILDGIANVKLLQHSKDKDMLLAADRAKKLLDEKLTHALARRKLTAMLDLHGERGFFLV